MIRLVAAVVLNWCVVGLLPLQAADVQTELQMIAKAHQGKIAYAIKNLETGERFEFQGDEVMQTASLIKLAVMVEAYRQRDAGTIDFAKMITLTKDDKVPGSGILTSHFSDGASFSIRDAVRLMIVYSDNTATNMVLDQIGIKNVNSMTSQFNLTETRINAKVFKGSTTSVDPERTKKYSLGSTTANETLRLLELIQQEKAASAKSCQEMLEHLKANEDKDLLVRYLPSTTKVAHKTGATNRVRTDAGILYLPRKQADQKERPLPIAICVLTNENEDQRWIKENSAEVTIAKIAKVVHQHFSQN